MKKPPLAAGAGKLKNDLAEQLLSQPITSPQALSPDLLKRLDHWRLYIETRVVLADLARAEDDAAIAREMQLFQRVLGRIRDHFNNPGGSEWLAQ
jgi:hypothetical protein